MKGVLFYNELILLEQIRLDIIRNVMVTIFRPNVLISVNIFISISQILCKTL